MAPSKQLKITDLKRSAKKDRFKQMQDGDESMVNSPSSEGLAEIDLAPLSPKDAPVTNKSLHLMLQDLKPSLREDYRQITMDLWKDIGDIGSQTSHLETKAEELCMEHNEVADRLQQLEEDHHTLKHKLADMENRSQRNNARFHGITDCPPRRLTAIH
ncbi:Hypothetical predicted protein [Pelobates cultripes]|uniref:Uncharacterized protein n=1 Tax=Pelobates cultripes TaxID=61616 RepID=A0AAD1W1Y2_PELCU|nr:Hypothetical predicted protein [Pelobates cultripes]